ncbi:MAG: PAS domain S-box protein, partial [Bacteroidota bacterium]
MPFDSLENKPFILGDETYRSIIEKMKLGLLEVDLQGVVQFANASFCNMVEYTAEELIGKNASELLLARGSLSEDLVESHSEERKKGKHSVYEVQVIKKSGMRIWMMIGGGPLYNKEGDVIGSIGIHHDFTDQKNSEEKLRNVIRQLSIRNEELGKKEEYLKAINDFTQLIVDKNSIGEVAKVITDSIVERFDFRDCIVYTMDHETGELIQASAFGTKKDELGGVLNPIKVTVGKGIVGTVAKTGVSEIIPDTTKDERYIVDDEFRLSEITVPIIYDGYVLGVIDSEHPEMDYFKQEHLDTLTTIANVAAAKIKSAITWDRAARVRQELEESESKFRNIIDSALDVVIMIDSNGLITEWNKQAEEVLGFSVEEAMGQRLSKLIIPQQYKAAHEKGMKHFHKTGEGPVLNNRIEITAVRKSGEEFPIELSISPIKVNDEHFFSAFLRDISELKENQEKIEKSLERERELNEMKSNFVSMTSHEFRTPLTTIKMNVDLLNHRMEGLEGSEKIQKNLAKIDNEVERLRNLMDDILTIGRIEAGKIEVNLEKTSLVYLANKIIRQTFSSRPDQRKVAVSVYGKEKEAEVDPGIFEH